MTTSQANEVAMAIHQNEGKFASELTDVQVGMYLVDRNFDETPENIALVRAA